MTRKSFKKIGSCLIALLMVLGISFPVSAAETSSIVEEYTLNVSDSGEISMTRSNNTVGSVIASNSEQSYNPHLDSYIGINKTFVASTSSNGSSGAVFLYLKNQNGKQVSNDWIMGINDNASWTVTLPSSGTYTLRVVLSGTNDWVSFAAKWA